MCVCVCLCSTDIAARYIWPNARDTYSHIHTHSNKRQCTGVNVLYQKITLCLECAIIACGHLTNMQGCHGNCSGGLYVCAE